MGRRSAILAVACAVVLTAASGAAKRGAAKKKGPSSNRIEIRIHGLYSGEGWVICKLYDRRGWLKKALETATSAIERRAAKCVFENVAPGRYAVAAYHDENKNGQPDDDGMGHPDEGVCTTNNWSKLTEKPPFRAARFTYAGGVLTKSARMRYRQ